MKEKVSIRQARRIRVRIEENLINRLKGESKERKMSLSSYMNSILNSSLPRGEVLFEEKINKYERKEVKSGVYFTKSEMELLREYAALNDWSTAKEIRYRVISSLAKKPKLNKEELKAVYAVRSSINVLGANVNRLVRNNEFLSNENIEVCKNLAGLIKELKAKIDYLEKCSYSNFKLKKEGGMILQDFQRN